LIFVVLFFSLGYIRGAKGTLMDYRCHQFSLNFAAKASFRNVHRTIYFLVICSGLYVTNLWFDVFISGNFNFELSKLGSNYIDYYQDYERGSANIDLTYVFNILLQSCLTLTLFIGVFYFKQMPIKMRIIFLLTIISYALINILISGKMKFIGDLVIILLVSSLFSLAHYRKSFNIKRIFIFVIFLFLLLMLFSEILSQRYISAGISVLNIFEKGHDLRQWDPDSFFFKFLGNDLGFAVGSFFGYFTNGLYGLSLSMEMPFEWTYFVGNSYSLSRFVEVIADVSIIEHTYPLRVGVETGWDMSKWHSLFAWLASDITFFGVLPLAFIFGHYYGKLWVLAVSFSNPYAGPLFSYLSLGLTFSLSNNQIMHGMAGIITFLVLIILYFLKPNRCKVFLSPCESK